MRMKARLPQLLSAIIFCGAIVSAASLESNPAAAFGMGGFGRMGGFRGATPANGTMRFTPSQNPGPIVGVGRPSRGNGNGSKGHRHPIVAAGGPPALGPPIATQVPAAGGGASGSGVPPAGERRFVADEIVTENFPSGATPAIGALARRQKFD